MTRHVGLHPWHLPVHIFSKPAFKLYQMSPQIPPLVNVSFDDGSPILLHQSQKWLLLKWLQKTVHLLMSFPKHSCPVIHGCLSHIRQLILTGRHPLNVRY